MKKYKACSFCKNKILAVRQVAICDECLEKASITRKTIEDIQKSEVIDYILEQEEEKKIKEILRIEQY